MRRLLLLLLLSCGGGSAAPAPDLGPDLRPAYCGRDEDCAPPRRCVGGACAKVD